MRRNLPACSLNSAASRLQMLQTTPHSYQNTWRVVSIILALTVKEKELANSIYVETGLHVYVDPQGLHHISLKV